MVVYLYLQKRSFRVVLPYVLYRICSANSNWAVRLMKSKEDFDSIDAGETLVGGIAYKLSRNKGSKGVHRGIIKGMSEWVAEEKKLNFLRSMAAQSSGGSGDASL